MALNNQFYTKKVNFKVIHSKNCKAVFILNAGS